MLDAVRGQDELDGLLWEPEVQEYPEVPQDEPDGNQDDVPEVPQDELDGNQDDVPDVPQDEPDGSHDDVPDVPQDVPDGSHDDVPEVPQDEPDGVPYALNAGYVVPDVGHDVPLQLPVPPYGQVDVPEYAPVEREVMQPVESQFGVTQFGVVHWPDVVPSTKITSPGAPKPYWPACCAHGLTSLMGAKAPLVPVSGAVFPPTIAGRESARAQAEAVNAAVRVIAARIRFVFMNSPPIFP